MKKYLTFLLTSVFLLQIYAMHDDPDFDPQAASVACTGLKLIKTKQYKISDEAFADPVEHAEEAEDEYKEKAFMSYVRRKKDFTLPAYDPNSRTILPFNKLSNLNQFVHWHIFSFLNDEEMKKMKLTGKTILSKIKPTRLTIDLQEMEKLISHKIDNSWHQVKRDEYVHLRFLVQYLDVSIGYCPSSKYIGQAAFSKYDDLPRHHEDMIEASRRPEFVLKSSLSSTLFEDFYNALSTYRLNNEFGIIKRSNRINKIEFNNSILSHTYGFRPRIICSSIDIISNSISKKSNKKIDDKELSVVVNV